MGENTDIVARGFADFASTGEVTTGLMTPDFVWDMSHFGGWPEQQTYAGAEGTREFLRQWTEAWDDWELELQSLQEAGDRVLAVLYQRGRSKATGMVLEMTFAQVFTIRDGRQARMEMYGDVEEAKRAVGLPE